MFGCRKSSLELARGSTTSRQEAQQRRHQQARTLRLVAGQGLFALI